VAAYRRATPDEAVRLAAFCAKAYGEDASYFERRWEHDPASDSFSAVLEERGSVVAHLHVFARSVFLRRDAAPHCCACIGNVAVGRAHRGRRLSTQLLQECLADCRASGFTLSLLHTHLPTVYERAGYRTLPVHEVALSGASLVSWSEIEIDSRLQELYRREHGGRPGTVARDAAWWEARERWLGAEGWRTMGVAGIDGYCCMRNTGDGGQVDEAVGACGRLVRQSPPGSGSWRIRLPLSRREAAAGPEGAVRMGLALDPGADLSPLASEGAVSWRTDEF
jgi:predicted N-acetyltransferase YhbS